MVGFGGGFGDEVERGEDGERAVVCETGVYVLADGAGDGRGG
jgi:hypothetical protein